MGNTPTCVRAQGESYIDITWVSTNYIHYLHDWRVREDMMSFSDHYYIKFNIGRKSIDGQQRNNNLRSNKIYPRWKSTEVDEDIMNEVIEWHCDNKQFDTNNVNAIAVWIRQIMTEASDVAVKRIKKPQKEANVLVE